MNAFDLQVAQVLSQARLLERMLHDKGPWSAVIYGQETEFRVPASRAILEEDSRVTLVAYVSSDVSLKAIEVYCATDLLTARSLEGHSGPCRILIDCGITTAGALL